MNFPSFFKSSYENQRRVIIIDDSDSDELLFINAPAYSPMIPSRAKVEWSVGNITCVRPNGRLLCRRLCKSLRPRFNNFTIIKKNVYWLYIFSNSNGKCFCGGTCYGVDNHLCDCGSDSSATCFCTRYSEN